MRSTLLVSAFAGLALAAPRPQDIDFTLVDAAPDAVIDSAPFNVTSETVAIVPVAAAVAIASDSVTDVAEVNKKRDTVAKRDGNCAVQPAGTGPQVST